MKTYIECGTKFIALNYKVASTAICKAIAIKYYPNTVDLVFSNKIEWHQIPIRTIAPNFNFTAMLFREPISRFKSACKYENITEVDSFIRNLYSNKMALSNPHFTPQSDSLIEGTRIFKLESHLNEFILYCELDSLSIENNTVGDVSISEENLVLLKEIYARDIKIYNSIIGPGQTYNLDAPSEPNLVKIISKLNLKRKLDTLGKWNEFKTILAQDPDADDEFWLSQDIRTDDPIFTIKAPLIKIALNLSDEQFNSILQ